MNWTEAYKKLKEGTPIACDEWEGLGIHFDKAYANPNLVRLNCDGETVAVKITEILRTNETWKEYKKKGKE